MSTSATFPVSLYTTDGTIEDQTLTRDEWQQITVEVEALEANIGSSAQASAGTIQARIASISSGMGLSATGHGEFTSTAAAHPFSALTGTFISSQHGFISDTQAGHSLSALTGTVISFEAGGSTATYGLAFFTTTAGYLTWRDSNQIRVHIQRGLSPSTAAGGNTSGLSAIAFTRGGSTASGGLTLFVSTDGQLCWRSSADVLFILAPPT